MPATDSGTTLRTSRTLECGKPRRSKVPASGRLLPAAVTLSVLAGCGGAVGTTGGAGTATEAEWRQLREPRPEPLPGAVRITVSEVYFAGPHPWPDDARVDPGLGLSELVAANLLRRRDVRFVERRRFSEAAAAERRGEPAPPGRPPPGVSESVDLGIVALWIPTSSDRANLEIRLTRVETGDVVGATRLVVPADTDPVDTARAIVGGTLEVLDGLGRLPRWDDPLEAESGATANAGGVSRVSTDALLHFLRGLAAEERWSWEGARRGYQQALERDPDFHEARTALARAARLRLGGTLAES